MTSKGFTAVKRALLAALANGSFQHEARGEIEVKNLLAMGVITPLQLANILRRSKGTEYTCSPHHHVKAVDCHIIKTQGWYVKFYFMEPDTVFISVHR